MITESVIPDDGGREGKWVGLSIALILLVAAILLPHHQSSSVQYVLAKHQVSVETLEQQDLSMIGDLRLAHEEIRDIHQDSLEFDGEDSWPAVSELEALWLAPFVQDKSWQHKGKHKWQQVAPGVYQGLRQLEQGSASVILSSLGSEPEIWLNLDGKATPFTIGFLFSEPALINAGWQQAFFPVKQDTHLH